VGELLLFCCCYMRPSDVHVCCAWCVMLPLVLRCLFCLLKGFSLFKVLSQYMPGGTELKKKNLSQDSQHPSKDSNLAPPRYKPTASPPDKAFSLTDWKCDLYQR
jgi:hypothetical protein